MVNECENINRLFKYALSETANNHSENFVTLKQRSTFNAQNWHVVDMEISTLTRNQQGRQA